MLKKIAKKLFGESSPASPEGFFLKVRCSECGEAFNLFINRSTDLAQSFEEGGGTAYFLKKEIIGGRCKNLIHVRMNFDANRKLLSREIENGEFMDA